MPYVDLTELNVYEFGNKTDVDAFTTEIDNRFKSPATVTAHAATSTTPEAGIPVVYSIMTQVAAGTIDLTMPSAFQVTGLRIVKFAAAAGGASTVQLLSTAAPISVAVNCNVSRHVVAPASATMNDAASAIPAGGLLRVTTVGSNNNANMVTVTGYHY